MKTENRQCNRCNKEFILEQDDSKEVDSIF